jgi:hypothetical protein
MVAHMQDALPSALTQVHKPKGGFDRRFYTLNIYEDETLAGRLSLKTKLHLEIINP